MNINLKITSLIIFTLLFVLLPEISIAQPFDNNVILGITEPIIRDKEGYEGLDYFIYDYYLKYINEIKGLRTSSHYTASQMLARRFGGDVGIEEIYSGFISQLKLYMDFDLLMASEIYTVEDDEDGEKYIRLRVIIFNSNAEEVVKFKITTKERFGIIEYLNKSIKLIVNRIEKAHPDYDEVIDYDDEIIERLKNNEDIGAFPSLSYYYIKDYDEDELDKKEAETMKILNTEGYTQDDISKGFSRKYMELEIYHKALSYLLGTISREENEDSARLFLKIAGDLRKTKLYTTASEVINNIVLYKDLSDPILETQVNIEWSNILIELGDFTSAEALVIASSDTARKYGYVPFIIEAMTNYSLVYANVGEYKYSMGSLEYTRQTIEEIKSRLWASDFLYEEAKVRLEMSEFDEALKSSDLAEQLFRSAGKSEMLIKNHILRAKIYREIEEYENANIEINKAMSYVMETKDYIYIKEVNDMMRSILKRSMKAKRAYSIEQEREYVNVYNDHIKIIHDRAFLRGMARLLLYWERYDGAKDVLLMALDITKNIKSERYKYDDYMLLGNIYENSRKYELAFLNYAEALTSAEKSGSKVNQMECLLLLANMFYIRNNVDKALSTYQALAESTEIYGLFDLLEKSYYRMSLIYKEMGNEDKYIEYSRKAFNVAKKIGSFMVEVYNEPLKD